MTSLSVEGTVFCLLCQVAVKDGYACPACGAELVVQVSLHKDAPPPQA